MSVPPQILVWKELDYGSMTEAEKQMLVSEVNLLRELRHPNIVRYHDRIIDRSSTTLYIVMEYCDGGDLASLIDRCTRERHVEYRGDVHVGRRGVEHLGQPKEGEVKVKCASQLVPLSPALWTQQLL